MWKSWGEQRKKEGSETKEGKVTSPPGGASGQRAGEMNKDRMSGGFLDIKVRGIRRGCAMAPSSTERARLIYWLDKHERGSSAVTLALATQREGSGERNLTHFSVSRSRSLCIR